MGRRHRVIRHWFDSNLLHQWGSSSVGRAIPRHPCPSNLVSSHRSCMRNIDASSREYFAIAGRTSADLRFHTRLTCRESEDIEWQRYCAHSGAIKCALGHPGVHRGHTQFRDGLRELWIGAETEPDIQFYAASLRLFLDRVAGSRGCPSSIASGNWPRMFRDRSINRSGGRQQLGRHKQTKIQFAQGRGRQGRDEIRTGSPRQSPSHHQTTRTRISSVLRFWKDTVSFGWADCQTRESRQQQPLNHGFPGADGQLEWLAMRK